MFIAKGARKKIIKGDLNSCSKAIVKALLYFDIFNHPLTIEDIQRYSPQLISTREAKEQLAVLEEQGYIKSNGILYTLVNNNIDDLSARRINGQVNADKLLKAAKKWSGFISHFPFVEGICLSGSLSKGYADKYSDIDYFIVTKPGRLWLCRTLLILFKKLFLFNSHKYFCVNYFVDTNSLEIPDKNIFTATELTSVIPTYNPELYFKLIKENGWTKAYLPNTELKAVDEVIPERIGGVKALLENLLKGSLGELFDTYCFKLTLSTWRKKFGHFNDEEFDLRLRSKKNVSKHHPLGFQEKVLREYNERITGFEMKFNIKLG